jgi:hypothetical protein
MYRKFVTINILPVHDSVKNMNKTDIVLLWFKQQETLTGKPCFFIKKLADLLCLRPASFMITAQRFKV